MDGTDELSEGQREAVAALVSIAGLSGGDLLIEHGVEKLIGRRLKLRIWLSSAHIEASGNGIELASREPIDIFIPDDYPFSPPQASAGHKGFAGQTHVLWGRDLCLYASSAEWDPSAGMAGFLRRLLAFYKHLAQGTLSGPGAPWHPPIAHSDPTAGCVVVGTDLAAGDRSRLGPFLSWAVGIEMDEYRTDVVGWLTASAGQSTREGAINDILMGVAEVSSSTGYKDLFLLPAVVLPEPISFEYPETIKDLLRALEEAGIAFGELAWHLQLGIRINSVLHSAREQGTARPTFLVVRAPADLRFTTADEPAHFAAWRLASEDEALLSGQVGVGEAIQRIGAWVYGAKISWAYVYDTRSGATLRRDTGRPVEKLTGRRVLILGCGAIGAPIAEHCVRAGAAGVALVDWGVVNPGILVRQPYYDADIGFPKAAVLARRLRGVRPMADINGVVDDAVTFIMEEQSFLPDYDLVIDATADRSVGARIERMQRDRRHYWPDLVTVAINQTARYGAAAVTPRGSAGAGIDLFRRLALATCEDAALADVYRAFFPPPAERIEFEPERGCSGPTFIGSNTDVTALAAQLLETALDNLEAGKIHVSATGEATYVPHNKTLCVARLGRDDSHANARVRLVLPHYRVVADNNGTYEVRIDSHAMEEMLRISHQTRCGPAAQSGNETGGVLLGQLDDACRVVWVSEATGPPDGSVASPFFMIINTPAVKEHAHERSRKTGGLVSFAGLWHTHPGGAASPSEVDKDAMTEILAKAQGPSPRFVFIVLGLPEGGDGEPDIYAEVV